MSSDGEVVEAGPFLAGLLLAPLSESDVAVPAGVDDILPADYENAIQPPCGLAGPAGKEGVGLADVAPPPPMQDLGLVDRRVDAPNVADVVPPGVA
jgi:hypothetical protein